jgi:hypothetical protein
MDAEEQSQKRKKGTLVLRSKLEQRRGDEMESLCLPMQSILHRLPLLLMMVQLLLYP